MMAGFAVTAAVLGAASVITTGFGGVLAYFQLLLALGRHPAYPAFAAVRTWTMPTLRGLLQALLATHLRLVWIETAAVLISVLLLLQFARQWRRVDRLGNGEEQNLMFAATLTLALAVSPHLYPHDLTVMLLPAVLLIGSEWWMQNSLRRYTLIATFAILCAPPVYSLLTRHNLLGLIALLLTAVAVTSMLAASPADAPGNMPGAEFADLDDSIEAFKAGKHGQS
jgi:hypothetical protein